MSERTSKYFLHAFILGAASIGVCPAYGGEFWDDYKQWADDATAHPASTNLRVEGIRKELSRYSGARHQYPVLPAESFAAGKATPGGIYLDLSIAGAPDLNVTRFFLAHEWGHMVHGDPVRQFTFTPGGASTPLSLPVSSSTTIEDRADSYAATFMYRQQYDVTAVIEFLCRIPVVPGDLHSSGADRAKHVARINELHEDDPCADTPAQDHLTYATTHEHGATPSVARALPVLPTAPSTGPFDDKSRGDDSDLAGWTKQVHLMEQAPFRKEVADITAAAKSNFASVRSSGNSASHITLQLEVGGYYQHCYLEDTTPISCLFTVFKNDDVDAISKDYENVKSALTAALPGWKAVEQLKTLDSNETGIADTIRFTSGEQDVVLSVYYEDTFYLNLQFFGSPSSTTRASSSTKRKTRSPSTS
jgi:hypothetical protein